MTFEKVVNKLNNVIDYSTRLEKTLIVVQVDKIISEPWRDHRLELKLYSVRYQASTKTIFVYLKYETDASNYTDGDINSDGEFPPGSIRTIKL